MHRLSDSAQSQTTRAGTSWRAIKYS